MIQRHLCNLRYIGETKRHLCNLRYIGETKRRLKDCFNEHRRPVLNPTSIGNYILTAVSHNFDTHMLLIPIEKLKNGRDSFRKAREGQSHYSQS